MDRILPMYVPIVQQWDDVKKEKFLFAFSEHFNDPYTVMILKQHSGSNLMLHRQGKSELIQ